MDSPPPRGGPGGGGRGLPSPNAHTPSPCTPCSTLLHGAPPLACSAQVRSAEGRRERWFPLQPPPRGSPSTRSDRCLVARRWGFSSHPAHPSPWGPGASPHPAAMEMSPAFSTRREGGRGSTDQLGGWKGREAGAWEGGDDGPQGSQEKHPWSMIYSKPLRRRPRHQRIQNLAGGLSALERESAPCQSARSLPSQVPAGIPGLHPSLCASQVPIPPHPPPQYLHTGASTLGIQIPFPDYQMPAGGWPPRPHALAEPFWFPFNQI